MSIIIIGPGRGIWRYILLVAVTLLSGLRAHSQCPGASQTPFNINHGGVVVTNSSLLFSAPGSIYVQDGGLNNSGGSTQNIQGDVYINDDVRLSNGSNIIILTNGRLFVYGNMYVDSGSTLTIDTNGNLYFYGEQWISNPAAVINNNSAAGLVSYIMPRPAPNVNDPVSGSNRFPTNATAYTATADTIQFLDGGGIDMNVNIAQRNANNISLCNLDNSAAAGSGNTRLSGMLTFSSANGDIILNDNDFILRTTGNYAHNTINPYEGYFVTNGTGNVIKESVTGNASFTFPVGQAESDYTPATITNTSGAANNYTVQVKNYANTQAVITTPAEGIDRAWRIFSGTAGAASICLSHNTLTNPAGTGTNGALFNNESAFVTQQTAAGTWSVGTQTDGGSPVSIHCATETLATVPAAVTNYFTKTSDTVTPLPVILARFEGNITNCQANVVWQTATERNIDAFRIQHSLNGKDYIIVGEEKSRNSPTGAFYTFNYKGLASGDNYFRLQMVDKNDQMTYSRNIILHSDCSDIISFAPNPTKDNFVINGLTTGSEILVINAIGQQLIRAISSGNTININTEEWATGVYSVIIINNNTTLKVQKMVKL